jgi:hypothetical protein
MPSVTITLTDTPTGGVAVHSNYVPSLGAKTSLAQTAAQDIINRTCREYGMPNPIANVSPALRDGIDIDAVHRRRDNVVGVADGVTCSADARQ